MCTSVIVSSEDKRNESRIDGHVDRERSDGSVSRLRTAPAGEVLMYECANCADHRGVRGRCVPHHLRDDAHEGGMK